jgi:hypothetical protein
MQLECSLNAAFCFTVGLQRVVESPMQNAAECRSNAAEWSSNAARMQRNAALECSSRMQLNAARMPLFETLVNGEIGTLGWCGCMGGYLHAP